METSTNRSIASLGESLTAEDNLQRQKGNALEKREQEIQIRKSDR